MNNDSIFVTQPFLPPLAEFYPLLEEIWANKTLTNGGPFHKELENRLASYLGVEHICLFSNATIALVTALQALRITGEVITTPFSFVATSHSLLWNGIRPIFVDICNNTYNIDPKKIEEAITPETTAIMPVHCYGIPCEVEAIQRIADNFNLKVIYDAAHAFGVQQGGQSILKFGDLSVLSFHATKVFNTFEGGAIVCPDLKTKHRIDRLKNFGFVDETTVMAAGINGKMSEVNAAFGIVQLKHIDHALAERKRVNDRYIDRLAGIPGICIAKPEVKFTANHSYFPIRVSASFGLTRDELYARLKDLNIFARRYFYPLISSFPMYKSLNSSQTSNLPVATHVANEILCLPIYPNLSNDDVDRVVDAISKLAAK